MITASDFDTLAWLEPNWDSYAALAPHGQALETARRLVDSMVLVPVPDGGVQIEMCCTGLDVEIVLGSNGHFFVNALVDPVLGEVDVTEAGSPT